MAKITKEQYEFALSRIEELLPMVDDNSPANDRNAVELRMMSDVVIDYEKHRPVDTTVVEREKHESEAVGYRDWGQPFTYQRLCFRQGRTYTENCPFALCHFRNITSSHVGLLNHRKRK